MQIIRFRAAHLTSANAHQMRYKTRARGKLHPCVSRPRSSPDRSVERLRGSLCGELAYQQTKQRLTGCGARKGPLTLLSAGPFGGALIGFYPGRIPSPSKTAPATVSA